VTRHVRPDIAIVVFGNAIEFIRDECESDGVGPEKSAESLEQRATKAGVTGGISGKWWRKVWRVQIASWGTQRCESSIAYRCRITITSVSRASSWIRFTNAGDRAPKIIKVLRFPNRHTGVGHRRINQRQQTRKIESAQLPLISDPHRDLIVKSRRRTETGRSIVSPERANKSLFCGPLCRRHNTVATDAFHFVVCGRVFRARHCRRRRNAKLLRRFQDESIALAPVCAESERDQANRILTPMPREIACEIIDADTRLRNLRAVVDSHGKNGSGRPPP